MTSAQTGQKMRVAKQLAREFWLPLLLAVCWTLFRYVSIGGGILTAIADFAGAFFLASWATLQFIRVNRQQAIEDKLQTIVQRTNDMDIAVRTISNVAQQLQQQTKDIPGLNETVQKLVASTTQVSQANNAISAATNELPPMGWISDWPLPHRPRPDPRTYATGGNTSVTPLSLGEGSKKP
jgi:hypothetical protein